MKLHLPSQIHSTVCVFRMTDGLTSDSFAIEQLLWKQIGILPILKNYRSLLGHFHNPSVLSHWLCIIYTVHRKLVWFFLSYFSLSVLFCLFIWEFWLAWCLFFLCIFLVRYQIVVEIIHATTISTLPQLKKQKGKIIAQLRGSKSLKTRQIWCLYCNWNF